MSSQPTQILMHGIVKQVTSGDSIVIRSHSRGGPPKERTLGLSNIVAPKLARKINNQETKDEPYAWEAREFLRKKIIGKEISFTVEKIPNAAKEYGIVYIGKDTSGENVTESLVSEGLVDVRRAAIKLSEFHQKLCELEDIAKAEGKGKHGQDGLSHIRDVKWSVENPANFVDSFHKEPVKAIVEHVRDGSNLRVVLLPDYYYITLMLSGIRCPLIRTGENEKSDPFAEEAKFFTECRLLQRDVEVVLETVSNQNFFGSVLHPNGDIAVLLLKEGFARCVDWNILSVHGGPERLRAAERSAKEKKIRIWRDYNPSGATIDAKEREFQAKVIEITSVDSLMLKLSDGTTKKIFLASIRPPRLDDVKNDTSKNNLDTTKTNPIRRPLYDIPYMLEAREFLRKKLIGKKVTVTIDYKQPASQQYPEKTCCTVLIGGVNVAEALVSKGLATVIRYRADDDQRSSHYDDLLSAETKASKSGKGLHNKKESPPHRVVDLSGDTTKSKQFLPFFQREGHTEAVVEFVSSANRFRLYVPRDNCLITFIAGGITCPRPKRVDPKTNTVIQDEDPWGEEALNFTRDLCMQREVDIVIESMDKAGNFIGWLSIENTNISLALVEEGFAQVHFSAERSAHYPKLKKAESEAQAKKLKTWQNYVHEEIDAVEETERVVNPKRVLITQVGPGVSFYCQSHDDGPKLEQLMKQLRQEFTTGSPLPGTYFPKKNDLCAAKFSEDGLWYRAKVEKADKNNASIFYVDYGNRETTSIKNLAALPQLYRSLPYAAQEYTLAFVKVPKDEDSQEEAERALRDFSVLNFCHFLNEEYKIGSTHYVTLTTEPGPGVIDIGKDLVENGYLIVDERREKRFQKIIKEYLAAQEKAKKDRLNLWCYGDITEDDAKEFG